MKSLGDARASLIADDFSFNESIRTRFISETTEILQDIDIILPKWAKKPNDLALLTRIRHNFHTLSVSSNRVGANTIKRVSLVIEDVLDDIFNKNIEISKDLIKLLTETKYVMPFLVDDFTHKVEPSSDPAIIILKAENLRLKRDIYLGIDIEETIDHKVPWQVPPPVKIISRFALEDDDDNRNNEKNMPKPVSVFPNPLNDDVVNMLDEEIDNINNNKSKHDENTNYQNMFDTPTNPTQTMADGDNISILSEVQYQNNNDIHDFNKQENEKMLRADINKRKNINLIVGIVIVILLVIAVLVFLFKQI